MVQFVTLPSPDTAQTKVSNNYSMPSVDVKWVQIQNSKAIRKGQGELPKESVSRAFLP
jgi:hypothetical protein